MSNFVDLIMNQLGGSSADKIGNSLGVSSDKTQQVLSMLTPVLLGGLKKQKEAAGESGIESLLEGLGAREDADEHIEDFLPTGGGADHSNGFDLGSILGPEQSQQTADAISNKIGIDSGTVQKLIMSLAPIILGMLMKQGRQDPGTQTRSGGIASILDRDGDGSIVDDVAGMIFKKLR